MDGAMIVVGAGQAGGRAALTLRDSGWTGRIVLVGEEGFPPYERPPLSKSFLRAGCKLEDIMVAPRATLAEAKVELRLGTAVEALDRSERSIMLGNGERLRYEKLLLATGRTPRRLALPEGGEEQVRYLRTIGDAENLRRSLTEASSILIVGGGLIGLEVAAGAAALGCSATVVELGSRLLARSVPEPLAEIVHARHERAGVRILLDTRLIGIREGQGRFEAKLSDGRVAAVDLVLAGVGAMPRTELAERAGLEVDGGIVVNSLLATGDPRIFAAGDVCAFPHRLADGLMRLESWQAADRQGVAAARNMVGAAEPFRDVPWYWSDQYDLSLQIAGTPGQGVRVVSRAREDGGLLFHLGRSGRLVGVGGIGGSSIGRDVRIAQMMIERGITPDPAALADPARNLRDVLREAAAAPIAGAMPLG